MSKFKLRQKVKIINLYPYSNTTGTIVSISSLKLDYYYYYYHVHLDEKFHKKFEDDGYDLTPIILEKCLVLANGSLIANE